MDYDSKTVQDLLKEIQNDPHLQTTDDTTVMWDELYPVTHHAMLPNVLKVKSSLKNALSLISWDPARHKANLTDKQIKAMTDEKERIEKSLLLTVTPDIHWNDTKFTHWSHRMVNLCLDALQACFRDGGHVTDTFKMIFKPSDTVNTDISSSDNRNVKGYSFSHKILVDHPFEFPEDADAAIDEFLRDTQPVLMANQSSEDSSESTKAKSKVHSLRSATRSMLKQIHRINTHTLLVL